MRDNIISPRRPPDAELFAQAPQLWAAARRYAAPSARIANNPLYLQDLTPWPGPIAVLGPIDIAVVHNYAVSDRVLDCGSSAKAQSMPRRGFISVKACIIGGCFIAIMPADVAHAQTKKQTTSEETLASKIRCQDFQKNPNTRIGKIDFSTHTFGVGEVAVGGADLASLLDRKCAPR
jgi:hypothetical protein